MNDKMSNPNRLRTYYPYRCRRCGRLSRRGSSAKRCNLPYLRGQCLGVLQRVPGGKCETRPLKIMRKELTT